MESKVESLGAVEDRNYIHSDVYRELQNASEQQYDSFFSADTKDSREKTESEVSLDKQNEQQVYKTIEEQLIHYGYIVSRDGKLVVLAHYNKSFFEILVTLTKRTLEAIRRKGKTNEGSIKSTAIENFFEFHNSLDGLPAVLHRLSKDKFKVTSSDEYIGLIETTVDRLFKEKHYSTSDKEVFLKTISELIANEPSHSAEIKKRLITLAELEFDKRIDARTASKQPKAV